MDSAPLNESHHGVLMNISGCGLLITGKAASGKSSFALELLHHDHQLIADDVVEFSKQTENKVVGSCPPMLSGLLHTRELGLLDIETLFGQQALCKSIELTAIVHLTDTVNKTVDLHAEPEYKLICNTLFPCLQLSLKNPASLYHRLQLWLKLLNHNSQTVEKLQQRQYKLMTS